MCVKGKGEEGKVVIEMEVVEGEGERDRLYK